MISGDSHSQAKVYKHLYLRYSNYIALPRNPSIMANSTVLYMLLLAALVLNCHCDERKLHVVYMGDRPQDDASVASTHHTILQSVLGSASSAKDSLVHSYGRSFNGFAAKLSEEEATTIAEMEGVVSVFQNRKLNLHTTRSWDFMGFSKGELGPGQEGNIIIGFIDTGAWPEHPSFNDTGYGPPPAKWKGTCQTKNFTCNNKLIGARYYNSEDNYEDGDIPSPRDTLGHGTHTASTAAGNELAGTSFLGLAEGLARGGVPNARIAVYKVCWVSDCGDADILKAFDDAIADGVDVLSVSLGYTGISDYFEDSIAIGTFHAMRNGILTSCSAGNAGPDPVSLSNYAPWILTVAASTIDRKFISNLVLGNGETLTGIAVNSFDLNGTSYPLMWGGDAVNYTFGYSPAYASTCDEEAMNHAMIPGKIVMCEGYRQDGSTILLSNGVGSVIVGQDEINPDYAFTYPLPATLISPEDAKKVMAYIRSTINPVATILVGETWKDAVAPRVVSFSSRGPSPISPDILKPDVTGPGVNILAGWSPLASPSMYDGDTRSVYFKLVSGTSMACPHASATAAYVKAAHPDWSPASIKSAIMTTAYVMDPRLETSLEFAYGSGHINPNATLDPGLVFNASEADYINFLCKQGYNTTTLRLVTGDNSTCTSTTPGRAWDLNYPSFSLYVEDGQQIIGTFTRTVTNVGATNSTYTASMYMPPLINVKVEPSVLTFSSTEETQTFTVTVTGPAITQQPIMSGAIMWSDGIHSVRTPLVVYNYYPGAPYTTDFENSITMEEKRDKLKGSFKHHRNGML
ncbi:subtilisin-like protease SBT4.3 [Salvia miltiorrhiza]|uniref:subtilisin-like protease SBT4.3 n=1 Tax=Salvia miltiorrhiza TaxID=226208 RepID=UPI0025AC3916|nr:subtilisin-like protease SBT4.3 [Salvia miltiorrhiza]